MCKLAVEIPYKREMEFEYGRIEQVAPGVRRVIANNPSAFTFHGTGTYILGEGEVAVIDPDNVDVRLLLEECSILLVTVARDARKHGYKELALKYLELAISIKPNQEDWLAMRAAWST